MKTLPFLFGLVIGVTSGLAIAAPDTSPTPAPLPPDHSLPSDSGWWQGYGTLEHAIIELDTTGWPEVTSC
jgi:hypothetical protein